MESVEAKKESLETPASPASSRVSSRGVVEAVVFFSGVAFATSGWYAVSSAVGDGRGDWLFPILWFSGAAVAYLIGGMLFRGRTTRIAFVVAMLVTSLPFAPSFWHLLLVGFGILSLAGGFRKMGDDVGSRVSLHFRRSMGMGMFAFSLAVSLLIASEYYVHIRAETWEELVPKFSLGAGGGDVVLRVAGTFYPELGSMNDEGMTVDMFLENVRQSGGFPEADMAEVSLNPEEQLLFQEQAAASAESGRAELGQLIGRSIAGDERMTDIFSEAIRGKLLAFLSGAKAERNLPNGALPFVLSVLLFVTALSIASFLRGLWVVIGAMLLRGLIRIGVLSVDRVPTEQEVLR